MQKLLTPPNLPIETVVREIEIPSSKEWLGIFNFLLLQSIYAFNWEQVNATDLTPDECAALCYEIYVKYLSAGTIERNVPAPYWDVDSSADDEEPIEIQPWYGVVEDFFAPIDEITFTENAAVWAITGFVAYAAGVPAAVTFRTVARNFVIAIQREDVGEAIRVVVNGVQETRIDTTPYAAGEIIEVPIAVETEEEFYDIIIFGDGGTE